MIIKLGGAQNDVRFSFENLLALICLSRPNTTHYSSLGP